MQKNITKKEITVRKQGAQPTHGMTYTRPFRIWAKMRARCNHPNDPKYPRYGGRGIKVSESWNEFSNFWKDMSPSYGEGLSIDRIDNDGDYCKGNCRWATNKEQMRNVSYNHNLTHKGKTQPIRAWEDELGFNSGTLWARINVSGWDVERALTTKTGGGSS